MTQIPNRKYRGALRIAPLRQAAVSALAGGEIEDAYEAEQALRAAGFPAEADRVLDLLDARTGTKRCRKCRHPLGTRQFHAKGSWLYNDCGDCDRYRDEVRATRENVKRWAQVGLRIQANMAARDLRQDPNRWPWRRVPKRPGRPAHYVLQRSWMHLRDKLPVDPMSAQAEAVWEEVEKIIRAERARRDSGRRTA